MPDTISVRDNHAAELTWLAREIRDTAHEIQEAMFELADLAVLLPTDAAAVVDNHANCLLECGIGLDAVIDSLEEAAASLLPKTTVNGDNGGASR